MKYVILVGDPISGFEIHGSWDTPEEAAEWVESADFKEATWIALMHSYEDKEE